VQDALDLIEFANGDVTTKWGKLRADMGHPASFGLELIAVGNEQWGSMYPERLVTFVKAIREKHPEIRIIGSSGPSPDGKDFDYGCAEMKRLKVDLVDEHYYKDPQWFLNNAKR
jgi:alpha-L-arabinofuranosidase